MVLHSKSIFIIDLEFAMNTLPGSSKQTEDHQYATV